ncbi:hypothetical protein [Flavivirga jejuensis]|uniref:Uncharacterized protein n=1 Tax=Flavivirga jejuensis TaxID=870487 RepID=A0ABT8WRC1_9FLAO|nr:hypothetical protein [Flavivirga jejuensis]MDO5975695.1 hypothetical protein [Flavivirga jejuensis]
MDDIKEKSKFDNMIYVVINNKTEFLGAGTAIETLKIVKGSLPNNITPAIKGTTEG